MKERLKLFNTNSMQRDVGNFEFLVVYDEFCGFVNY